MTQDADVEIYRGVQLRIVAVRDAAGRCPAKEFLYELQRKQQRAYAQFGAGLKKLADTGRLTNTEQMRRIKDDGEPPVYELKAHDGKGWRLYGIQDGDTWHFTHGRAKPKDRAVGAEAKKARRLYKDRSK